MLHLHHRDLHSFPTRRSSDLAFISTSTHQTLSPLSIIDILNVVKESCQEAFNLPSFNTTLQTIKSHFFDRNYEDRKSTRLNSSHMSISYAVFCLKKIIPFFMAYIVSYASPPPPRSTLFPYTTLFRSSFHINLNSPNPFSSLNNRHP